MSNHNTYSDSGQPHAIPTPRQGMNVNFDQRQVKSNQAEPISSPTENIWLHKAKSLCSSGLFLPLLSLVGILILIGISGYLMQVSPHPEFWFNLQIILLGLGAVVVGIMLFRVHHYLMQPLENLREWATQIRAGDLSARLSQPYGGQLGALAKDINALGEQFMKLSREMDHEVEKQTKQLEQKSRSLEILYDVAASINSSRDLDDLLKRFLVTLSGVVNAHAATVRLLTEDDQLKLIASHGLDPAVIEQENLVPVSRCLCGEAVRRGGLMTQDNINQCSAYAGRPFLKQTQSEMIAVPMQYRGKILGVFNLFVDQPGLVDREDTQNLLTSIGRHLGVAIEKARLDTESKRVSILQERNMLSHELHDSLAQTLASLRFQVRMLDDSIQRSDNQTANKEIQQLKNGIDEAYTELRELLSHFRAPFDERGLIHSIEAVVDRFSKETEILTYFQNQWTATDLPSILEMQVLRIIQESLTNIRKHSNAHTVRILLRSDAPDQHMALIEDDGVGIGGPTFDENSGEHIGLSIMKERAKRIGGKLKVESEPGEGTRIILSFTYPPRGQQNLPGLN